MVHCYCLGNRCCEGSCWHTRTYPCLAMGTTLPTVLINCQLEHGMLYGVVCGCKPNCTWAYGAWRSQHPCFDAFNSSMVASYLLGSLVIAWRNFILCSLMDSATVSQKYTSKQLAC